MHIPFCRKDKGLSLTGIGDSIHIGVESDVVCSISIGMQEPRWVGRTNRRFHAFLYRIEPMLECKRSDMSTLSNVETRRGEAEPPSVRLTSDTIPEATSSKTGVSVRYVPDPTKSWYVFRASYGREDKAADYIINDGTYAYIAKRIVRKSVNNQPKKVLESLIPNLLFVYTNEENAEQYVKYTPALSFLSYYYNHLQHTDQQKNPPLTIACHEMENFIRATQSMNEHLMFVTEKLCHFKSGDTVKISDGLFKGVEGRVARVAGQQRVILSLSILGLVSTAYIPSEFLQSIKK